MLFLTFSAVFGERTLSWTACSPGRQPSRLTLPSIVSHAVRPPSTKALSLRELYQSMWA